MKKCPFCSEEIQNDAVKCRYCMEFLNKKIDEVKPTTSNIKTNEVKPTTPNIKNKEVKWTASNYIIIAIFIAIPLFFFFNMDITYKDTAKEKTTTTTSTPKPSKYGEIGDDNKYLICYGEMTKLYKQNGYQKSNRSASIEAKEIICRAYSRGEQNGYPKL